MAKKPTNKQKKKTESFFDKVKKGLGRQYLKVIFLIFISTFIIIGEIFAFNYLINLLFARIRFNFISYMFAAMMLYIGYHVTKFAVKEYLKLYQKTYAENKWLVLAVTLVLLVLILGFVQISNAYRDMFPIRFIVEAGDDRFVTSLFSCRSGDNLDVPVIGDSFVCDGDIKAKTDNFFTNISYFEVKYMKKYRGEDKPTKIDRYNSDNLENNTLLRLSNLVVPIEETERASFSIRVSFRKGPERVNIDTYPYSYFPFTNKEYQQRGRDRMTFLFLLISIGIFSVLAAVKNLRSIVEGNRKGKNEKKTD